MPDVESRTIRKVWFRLIPFLIVCYFVAFLDRVNVGFAALAMNRDLGLSAAMYGFGAGIFFVAYFLFEVPSNVLLERYGARRWIARIMVSWGALSGLMAVIPWLSRVTGLSPEHTFYGLRVLLGAAEAGFFPGIIFYLTLWFPTAYRARVVGSFMIAIPLSNAVGAPISGWLLGFDGWGGMAGWQWLFILEAVPAVALGLITYFYLTDRPADAGWLDAGERAWLTETLAAERRTHEKARQTGVLHALANPRVLALSAVYFGATSCGYTLNFWLPQIVKEFGLTDFLTGCVAALPYVAATIAMLWYGYRSDRHGERRRHTAVALALTTVGFVVCTAVEHPGLKVAALALAAAGNYACKPVFWTLPTAFLSGTGAAVGIAAINSIGNLSGFASPYLVGWLKNLTGTYDRGLLAVSIFPAVGAVIVMCIGRENGRTTAAVLEPSSTGATGAK